MLADYKVGRCSRRCYIEDRPLEPGETFYSVVIPDDHGELQRRDYSARAWTDPSEGSPGPPEGTLGWWKGRIPEAGEQKLVLAPNPVLIEILRQLLADPGRGPLAYLLALLLMRRRVVRPLPSTEPTTPADAAAAVPVLTIEVLSDGETIDVPQWEIRPEDAAHLRDELNELLYCEAE